MPVLARILTAPLIVDIRRGAVADLGVLLADRRIATEGRVAVAVGRGQGDGVVAELDMETAEVFRVEDGSVDAAIALGCVIRGDTIHFEIVSMESSRALMDLAVAKRVPLGNGIITVNTDAQAWVRARAGELDKGGDAARAALAMLRIKRRLTRI